ncbi:MAG: methyltransferase domain-containing protein [Proteobacteria bacterium]|nr:methyltransferase domain-containing protein [Pseudomonadota bacterium]MBU1715989.1 methyltransferase domain-containing protein [Pseudomonadota bacterium]
MPLAAAGNNRANTTPVYDASSITVLSGLEAIRKNPGMYIGSTGIEGLHQLVFELVDNAIDETQAGECTEIKVMLEKDGSCSVEDNGRGIPTEFHPGEGCPACEVVLTRLHAGGKFKAGSYQLTTGLYGIGLSCLNALSEQLALEVWRGGHCYRQSFACGATTSPLEKGEPTAKRGTKISFRPDFTIFDQQISFDYQRLAKRLEELAFLQPGVQIRIDDKRSGQSADFVYDSGIAGFLRHLNESVKVLHHEPITIDWQEDGLEFAAVLQWTDGYGENILSYVNSINTIYGGTHVAGLKTALTGAINAYARETKMLKNGEGERITTFDILEGLTGVLSVRMTGPSFEGQTKTRVTNEHLGTRVEQVVHDQFLELLHQDSKFATRLVNRALDATRARIAARRASDRVAYQAIDTGFTKEVYQKQFGIRSKNWHQSATWIAHEELLGEHVKHLTMEPDARMLDVCCGSGVVGASFKGKVGKMIGLDITPEMIDLARTRLDQVNQGTVYDLPFLDGSFDLVVNREVLHLLPNPERPVSEIFRVLKPGGQFIVGQILPFGPEDAAWMYRVFKKKQPLIFNMFQEDDFRTLLLGAGFIDLQMTEYNLWESIDLWIDTHETTNLHRHEIRDLFYNAPQEARDVHPFEILPSGEIRDLWRWCIFSVRKPAK